MLDSEVTAHDVQIFWEGQTFVRLSFALADWLPFHTSQNDGYR